MAIDMTEDYFRTLGIPSKLSEIGITDKDKFEEMAENAAKSLSKAYVPLSKDDVLKIFEEAF
ncbi:NADH-dependent butanol dehydrogenase A [bioreactor metagenome]|uniref:NADH-dependent butanol dehydrogenase A n=1 Tax=bioreactor metagenome TaxID=1076179 RepID=A0A644ZNN6_9ZZZZ